MNSYDALRSALADVVLTTITPFDRDGNVDIERIGPYTRFLVESGITSLLPAGNTGEFFALSPDECAAVTAAMVEAADGRAHVISGISFDTGTAIRMAKAAQAAGAVGVMLHNPIHTHMTDEGLYRHIARIADALEIGLVLYKRGPQISDAVLARAVLHENVIGVKYGENNLNRFAIIVEEHPDDVVWVCGTAERWAPFYWLAGARGFTSGLGNFAPKESLDLLAALRNSEWERAMVIRSKITPFETIRDGQNLGQNVPAVKEAMDLLGLAGGPVREPLSRLPAAEREKVAGILESWGYRAQRG